MRLRVTQSSQSAAGLFTIGHSNLETGDFIAALRLHSIAILCDVRSRPGSCRFPQFNRESLEEELAAAGIRYHFAGEELGGRPEDPRAYSLDGSVDYPKRRESRQFQDSLAHIMGLARERAIALMCAEEDPLECHRFLLICPALISAGVIPQHIRRRGVNESQSAAEDRLLELHGFHDVTTASLFSSGRDAALAEALRRQSKEFAFHASPEALESLG